MIEREGKPSRRQIGLEVDAMVEEQEHMREHRKDFDNTLDSHATEKEDEQNHQKEDLETWRRVNG